MAVLQFVRPYSHARPATLASYVKKVVVILVVIGCDVDADVAFCDVFFLCAPYVLL